jgi:hypothetical protein
MQLRLLPCLPLVFCLLAVPAAAEPDEYAQRQDGEASNSVLAHIEGNNCDAAVKALNKGLAARHPGVMLLAGSMFEQGLCIKQDWTKAAYYYQMAHAAGKREALPRLVSGYAEKNRDPAAAMWWMSSQDQSVPAACRSANHLVHDPDAFVAALNAWPQGNLAACVYIAGVVMRIAGDVEFPARGAQQGVFGEALMQFSPSTASVTWKAAATDRISVTRQVQAGDDERSVFSDHFIGHLRAISDRALKAFVRPEGIDPAWSVQVRYAFKYGH